MSQNEQVQEESGSTNDSTNGHAPKLEENRAGKEFYQKPALDQRSGCKTKTMCWENRKQSMPET